MGEENAEESKMTIELDCETADRIAVAAIKDAVRLAKENMAGSSVQYPKAHHMQNVMDYAQFILAAEIVLTHFGAE